jgi:hypothetical protein
MYCKFKGKELELPLVKSSKSFQLYYDVFLLMQLFIRNIFIVFKIYFN